MALTSLDVVNSLFKDPSYVNTVLEEMLPDDTMELLQGTRKGKSEVSRLDHLKG